MGNTAAFADRELWDANYDDVADAATGFVPYGGWQQCVIKQFRGSTAMAGVGGLDVNVLSVEKLAQLTAPGTQADQPSGTTSSTQDDQPPDSAPSDPSAQPDPSASTDPSAPADPSASADTDPRETPDDWLWPTWREAAIQYKAIADELGIELAAAKNP